MVRDVCGIQVPDGIVFDLQTLVAEEIQAHEKYSGVRVRLEGRLAEAVIPLQVDVGFGDAVVPAPQWEEFPSLLGHSPPRILAYPREVVVAEKLEAMVSLGVTNSRMKDFYDVNHLAGRYSFEGEALARAIRATFDRRRTEFPDGGPLALTPGFLTTAERQTQWRAFLRRGRLQGPEDAGALTESLRRFLLPVLESAARGDGHHAHWPPGGPWVPARGKER